MNAALRRAHMLTLDEYDRRLVLAARSQLRWGEIAILWPASATSMAEADPDWMVDVLSHAFEAIAVAAGITTAKRAQAAA